MTSLPSSFLLGFAFSKELLEEMWLVISDSYKDYAEMRRYLSYTHECLDICLRAVTLPFGRFFSSTDTVQASAYIALLILGLESLLNYEASVSQKLFVGFLCGGSWLKLLFLLRGLYWFGPRLIPIFRALGDTLPFAFMVVLCVVASAHSYYLVCPDVEIPAYASFSRMFRLGIHADFDLLELEGVDPTYHPDSDGVISPEDPPPGEEFWLVQIVFLFVSSGSAVLLMNLFIGVLSSNYDRFEDMSQALFMRHRAVMLWQYTRRPWTQLWLRMKERKAKVNPMRVNPMRNDWKSMGHDWLIVAERDDGNLAEERSLRRHFSDRLKKQNDEIKMLMNSEINTLVNGKIETMDGRIETIDRKMEDALVALDGKFEEIKTLLSGMSSSSHGTGVAKDVALPLE